MATTSHAQLEGLVTSSFANTKYITDCCETPVPPALDMYSHLTCLNTELNTKAMSSYQIFLATWAQLSGSGIAAPADSLARRPVASGARDDLTPVVGQWITRGSGNISEDSVKYGRLVQDVTLAFPHANVANVPNDPINHIIQPDDLQGRGEYLVEASVPAPTVNVLCAGLSEEEIKPLIYRIEGEPKHPGEVRPAVDHLFDFNQSLDRDPLTPPPQFPKVPIYYNTIVNYSVTCGHRLYTFLPGHHHLTL